MEQDGERPSEAAPEFAVDERTNKSFVSWFRSLPQVSSSPSCLLSSSRCKRLLTKVWTLLLSIRMLTSCASLTAKYVSSRMTISNIEHCHSVDSVEYNVMRHILPNSPQGAHLPLSPPPSLPQGFHTVHGDNNSLFIARTFYKTTAVVKHYGSGGTLGPWRDWRSWGFHDARKIWPMSNIMFHCFRVRMGPKRGREEDRC
jgi:hypothetical protein